MPPFTSRPKKEFFVFDKPMSAKGREENFLGVAFEEPDRATGGRFTPRGPRTTAPPVQEGDGKTTIGYLKGMFNYATGAPDTLTTLPTTSPAQPSLGQSTEGPLTYKTPCPWPKDLGVDDIYPNEPTIAIGVEAIRENVKDAQTGGRIIDAICYGLRVNKEDLDTVVIPILRRHSMEDPSGKIEDLLGKAEYRKRIIKLFEEQKTPGKKSLYVATNIVACSGVSHDHVSKEEQELQGHVGDPTHTVPVRIGGRLRHLKRSTLKGSYESEVLLCMSYRRISYEHITQERSPGFMERWRGKTTETRAHDPYALPYPRDDGTEDIFWIDNYETKGEVPAFMGPELHSPRRVATGDTFVSTPPADARRIGILEDAILADSRAGAEGSDEEEESYALPKRTIGTDESRLKS